MSIAGTIDLHLILLGPLVGGASNGPVSHEKLTFRHAGRDFRLTDVHGRVVSDLLA